MRAQLVFAKACQDKDVKFWESVLWCDGIKNETFDHQYVVFILQKNARHPTKEHRPINQGRCLEICCQWYWYTSENNVRVRTVEKDQE